MNLSTPISWPVLFPALLRGETATVATLLQGRNGRGLVPCVSVIILGTSLFGVAMGCWRDPWQGLYTAIKFPLLILLTTAGNALLNGMLAPLLGINLRFRESLQLILYSFTIAAMILGSTSPLLMFLIWNAPPMTTDAMRSTTSYYLIQLTIVGMIALSGVLANLRLSQLLTKIGGSPATARRVLLAWLGGNLLLGSQLCWILRPFIGAPFRAVEFLRPDAFRGNFFETVFQDLLRLIFNR